MDQDDEVTPITNGRHAPTAEAIRITNIGLIFAALAEQYQHLGSAVDGLTELEKRSLETAIAGHLETSKKSLDVLIDELLNPTSKS